MQNDEDKAGVADVDTAGEAKAVVEIRMAPATLMRPIERSTRVRMRFPTEEFGPQIPATRSAECTRVGMSASRVRVPADLVRAARSAAA